MKGLINEMNHKSLNCADLSNVAYDLHIVKLRSPKVFEFIVVYFEKKGFTALDLRDAGIQVAVRFLKSIAVNHGQLNNKWLLEQTQFFIGENMALFDKIQTQELLDLFKFFSHLKNKDLKLLLESRVKELHTDFQKRTSSQSEDEH